MLHVHAHFHCNIFRKIEQPLQIQQPYRPIPTMYAYNATLQCYATFAMLQ